MDKREGKGIQLAPDGGLYEGDWKADHAEGYGRMRFASGGSYEGERKADLMHGRGKMIYASSGRRHEGLFEDGRRPAPGHGRGSYRR